MISTFAAAKALSVTKGAIFQAIKLKRLNAIKVNGAWKIKPEDIKKYSDSRHDRKNFKKDGKLVFDSSKGEYSIKDAAILLNCPTQQLYYACRKNKIKSKRKYFSWVIHINDLNEYRLNLLEKKKRKKHVLRDQRYCERCRKKIDKEVSYLRRIQSA